MIPFSGDLPVRVTVTDSPKTARAKYSGALNRRAKSGQDRGKEGQAEGGEGPADARGDRGHADGFSGHPLLGQGIPVEYGRRRCRRPRRLDQNGGDPSAIDRARIDPQQHHDSRERIHAKGERDQQGDPHGSGQPGNGADDDAEERAQDQRHDVVA